MINDQDQFLQPIKDKSDKKWTFTELRNSLICNESINAYYLHNWDDLIYNPKNYKKSYDDEIWKEVPNCGKFAVEASNKGRIKINKKIVEFYYEAQTDGKNKCEILSPDLLTDTKKTIGYLIPQIPDSKDFLPYFVYTLVAKAWLKNYGDGHIHHITNDGYDNRPENLIILDAYIHKNLHSGKLDNEPGNEYYPGKYDKK